MHSFQTRLLLYRCCRKRSKSLNLLRMIFCSSHLSQCEDAFNRKKVQTPGKFSDRNAHRDSYETELHVPVMKKEVLNFFSEARCKRILDMTFGAGGHSRALLDSIPDCHIIALDRDPQAFSIAEDLANNRPGLLTALNGRFSDLPALLSERNIRPGQIDGVLMDTGASSMQFDQADRGFSISNDGPLDMRMDGDRLPDQPTAADVVNSLDETDLAKIIRKYREDTRAKKIAHGIVHARSAYGRINTTKELAAVIEGCAGYYQTDKLGRYSHPATKVFQALRIFVNNELNELNSAIEVAQKYLRVGGLCIAITFHSLEDRIVKRHFNDIDMDEEMNLSIRQKIQRHTTDYTASELQTIITKKWEPLSKKVLVPSEEEVAINPRSRSAKLRVAVKAK